MDDQLEFDYVLEPRPDLHKADDPQLMLPIQYDDTELLSRIN